MRIRAEVELGAWQRGCSWDWGRLQALGGAWDLHAQGGFEEGLLLGVFVIYCPPPRDPAPFLLLQIFFSPSSSFFSFFFFFNVLIAPTISSGPRKRVENGGLGKGPLLP